jgi:cellulose biosynthesis protein BcsQ
VIPTTLAGRTLAQLVDFLDGATRPMVLPMLSMVDRRKRLHRELVETLAEDWPTMLGTAIPSASMVERMAAERAPVAVVAPNSAAAKAYRQVWSEIAGRLWV